MEKKTKQQLIEEIELLKKEKADYQALQQKLLETEEELFKSKTMFQLVIDNIPQFIFWKDTNSVFLGCNKLFAKVAGIDSPKDIVGKTDYDLPWEITEADYYREVDKRVITSKLPQLNYIETQKQADGKLAILQTSKVPLVDQNGTIIGLLGNFEDVTDKMKAESKFRDSQKRYMSLVEHSLVGIFVSQDHVLKFINQKLADFFGYDDPDELIGKHIKDIVDPKSWDIIEKEVQQRQTGNKVASRYDFTGIRKDGSKVYLEALGVNIELDGRPAEQGTLVDITERKQYEQALAESEQKFRYISEQSLMAISIIQDDKVIYANKAFADLLEFTIDEVSYFTMNDIATSIHPQDKEFVLEQHRKKIAGDADIIPHYAFRCITKTGKHKWVDLYSKIIKIDGQSANFVSMIDISDKVQAQQDLQSLNDELEQLVFDRTSQLQEALEEYRYENYERKRTQDELYITNEKLEKSLAKEKELNELKSHFVSMVSHEYRTPLTAIFSTTYIIEQYIKLSMYNEIGKQTAKIRRSVQDMTRLLEDVLTIGKADSEKMIIEPTKIDLIEECKDVIEENIAVDNNSHKFTLSSDSKSLIMLTDRTRIHHIISNLVSNAAKYSPKGSEVKLLVMDEVENVTIKCLDQGIGIPPENASKIFEPFIRFHNVGSTPGTGLGLAIVKKCVVKLNGVITFTSKVNEGTTFRVILPKDLTKPKKKSSE